MAAALMAIFSPLLVFLTLKGIRSKREQFIIALTDRGLLRVRCDRSGKPTVVDYRTDDTTRLGPINEFDDQPWVELNGARYWFYGAYSFEVFRMRRHLGTAVRS